MNIFRPVAVVPVYNHEHAIVGVVSNLLNEDLPVLLVNDGSDESCSQVLQKLAADFAMVSVLELPSNGGKGAAVKAGLREAEKRGYSHALQIDADGQHCGGDVGAFIHKSRENPQCLICGCPQYDDSVPRVRYYCRYLTHIWVWINTVSFAIKDSMCGFRVYPLPTAVALLDRHKVGDRMDFDTEILVKWQWQGERLVNIKTKVLYPEDGVSHFKAFHDNMLISWMHTRLFFGMLWRLPCILYRKLKLSSGHSESSERGC